MAGHLVAGGRRGGRGGLGHGAPLGHRHRGPELGAGEEEMTVTLCCSLAANIIHRQNVEVKNADSEKKSTDKMSKIKRRMSQMSNEKNADWDIR